MDLSSGTQSLIAGALIDFVGHLTTLPKPIKTGGDEPVYDVHDELTRWAHLRGFPLADVEVKHDWDKTASVKSLGDLLGQSRDEPQRIAGALVSFAEFVRVAETSDFEKALLKWATKTGLEIHDPQPRWSALWWA